MANVHFYSNVFITLLLTIMHSYYYIDKSYEEMITVQRDCTYLLVSNHLRLLNVSALQCNVLMSI